LLVSKASSVREYFVDVSAHFAEVGLVTSREIGAEDIGSRLPILSVLKMLMVT